LVRAWEGYHYKEPWRRLQQRGMAQNFGWDKSALEYVKVYRRIWGLPEEETVEERLTDAASDVTTKLESPEDKRPELVK
jgi:starch synthase